MRHLLNRVRDAIQKKGFARFCWHACVRCVYLLAAFPIALFIFVISPFVKIRLIKLYSSRIGHFGTNTHLLLCAMELNTFGKDDYKNLFYCHSQIANRQLYKMWKRVLPILPFPNMCFFVDKFLIKFGKKKYNNAFKITFESSVGGYDQWRFFLSLKKSYLLFTEQEKRQGERLLQQLGVPKNKKYVCLLIRDSKYLQVTLPNTTDWIYHSYRNANIEHYYDAMMLLVEKGYYVIRMGNIVEKPLALKHPQIIDYAAHSLQSDFMDIYLSAHCDFFISSSTGIDCIPQIAGRPLLVTNAILFDMPSYQNWQLCIPKKVKNEKTHQWLTLKEVFSDCQKYTDTPVCPGLDRPGLFTLWKETSIALVENSSEEILQVVAQMIAMQQGSWHQSTQDKSLQEAFWRCFPDRLKDLSTPYREKKALVGEKFLEDNKPLLCE